MVRIVIGSDHAGFQLKKYLSEYLNKEGYGLEDVGTFSSKSVDYPDYAKLAVKKIISEECKFGILICGTGVGMSITANRYKGIRAALCPDVTYAKLARQHNNANILVLGARVIDQDVAEQCVFHFIHTNFSYHRHKTRIDKIDDIVGLDN